LAEAERLLLKSSLPIAEVAYLSGFSSQSHLTTTMKQHKHITPAQIRAAR
jgi:AraC family transcriptional regulator